jgi:hypothetical protein
MATITYQYPINATVFHMDTNVGVNQAVVRAITANISQTGSTLAYDIAFSKSMLGSKIVDETTLYGDVDIALAAYKLTVIV